MAGLKAWVKSQAVMLYGVEHDELWVHQGFCEVGAVLKPFSCLCFVFSRASAPETASIGASGRCTCHVVHSQNGCHGGTAKLVV